jgi:hypothetical protein
MVLEDAALLVDYAAGCGVVVARSPRFVAAAALGMAQTDEAPAESFTVAKIVPQTSLDIPKNQTFLDKPKIRIG